jgi:hypothetical protein
VERDTDIYLFLVHRGRPSVAVEGAIEHFMRRLGDDIALVLGGRLLELGLDSGPAQLLGGYPASGSATLTIGRGR